VYVEGDALVLAAVAGDSRQRLAAVLAHSDVASISFAAHIPEYASGAVAARKMQRPTVK
jgi:hypothetical protein